MIFGGFVCYTCSVYKKNGTFRKWISILFKQPIVATSYPGPYLLSGAWRGSSLTTLNTSEPRMFKKHKKLEVYAWWKY